MDNENTRREVLEAAFDAQVETETQPEVPPIQAEVPPIETEVPPIQADETEAQKAERTRDEKGRFAEEEKKKLNEKLEKVTKEEQDKLAAKPPIVTKKGQPLTAADTAKVPDGKPEPGARPPASWKPLERESWGQVPKSAREAVERREREIETTLRESAEARNSWNRFREMAKPYEQMMLANGTTDPVVSASNLFRTAAIFQTGNDHQRAQAAAQVIAQFNVNPELVGAYLSGQVPQQGQMPQQAPPQYRDPRVDALEQRLEQARRQSQQAEESRMAQQIDEFAKTAPWFNDVRTQMADLIEVWTKRGEVNPGNLTEVIKKAYDISCNLDEGVKAAMKQREEAERAKTSQQTGEKSRAAASSIRSQPTVGGNGPPKGRRDALERAYDDQLNRRA